MEGSCSSARRLPGTQPELFYRWEAGTLRRMWFVEGVNGFPILVALRLGRNLLSNRAAE